MLIDFEKMQAVFGGVQKGVSKVIRVTGQALDKVGQALETNPHVDRRKWFVVCPAVSVAHCCQISLSLP